MTVTRLGDIASNKVNSTTKEYTIADLRRDKEAGSIYVTNNSNRDGQPAGEILFQVRVGGDETVAVKIERTWIPVDLAEFAPRDAVIASPHFLRAVSQKLIRLVAPEEAEKILSTSSAQSEYDRLRILRGNYEQASLPKKPGDQLENSVESAPKRELALGSGFEIGVNPQVVGLMNRPEFGQNEKQSALKIIEAELTETDLHYIFSKATADEIDLKNWAKSNIDLMRSS